MDARTHPQPPATPAPSGAVTTESAHGHEDGSSRGVTFRVVALCLALAVAFGYIIPIIDVKMKNTFLGAQHFPPGAIAVLLILLLVVNPILKLLSRRGGFSRNEILTVYITCLFSALVPGHGSENFFVTNLIGPFYFAKTENKWLDFLEQYLPSWFSPALMDGGKYQGAGYDAVQNWYVGSGGVVPWNMWIVPLVAWGVLIFVSYFMLACLSVIVRAQWSEREALAFPLLRLPLELTEDVDRPDQYGVIGRFFRNPLTWIGAGIGLFIQMLTGLNLYFPDVPTFPLAISGNFFSEVPWNQAGWINIQVYPIMIGITYLLTSEVSFSLWFFYWFIKFQLVAAYYAGFMPDALPNMVGNTGGAKIFTGYQHVGAYLGYVAIVLWTGREHLKHVARRAFAREKAGESEKTEALSYPVAFWGFVLSFIFIIGWSCAAGMGPGAALALWLSYLVISIALTRLVVEGGLLFVQQGWTSLGTMAQLVGSGTGTLLPPQSIVPGAFLQGSLMTDMRAFLLPSFVQGFKLAHDRKIRMKPLLALIMAVVTITLVMSMWMNVRLGYESGGLALESWFAQGGAQQPATNANQLISGISDVRWTNWIWLAVGAFMTYGMMIARSRFLWFPLHPLGFLMCLTYPIQRLWFSTFLGWMAKTLITRFGGSDTYRKATPLFLGLALGDIVMMLVWLLIDAWQGRVGHQLMPG
ncbi:MAG TPA: DUF6785 family protein [Abditibacteriaceae bacterium]|jgi:hypothetical protein